eukprot:UN22600
MVGEPYCDCLHMPGFAISGKLCEKKEKILTQQSTQTALGPAVSFYLPADKVEEVVSQSNELSDTNMALDYDEVSHEGLPTTEVFGHGSGTSPKGADEQSASEEAPSEEAPSEEASQSLDENSKFSEEQLDATVTVNTETEDEKDSAGEKNCEDDPEALQAVPGIEFESCEDITSQQCTIYGVEQACPEACGICEQNNEQKNDIDCVRQWSECTERCETAEERTIQVEIANSGDGAACPDSTDCVDGEGKCSKCFDDEDSLIEYANEKSIKVDSCSQAPEKKLCGLSPIQKLCRLSCFQCTPDPCFDRDEEFGLFLSGLGEKIMFLCSDIRNIYCDLNDKVKEELCPLTCGSCREIDVSEVNNEGRVYVETIDTIEQTVSVSEAFGDCGCTSSYIGDGECDLLKCAGCDNFVGVEGEFDGGDCNNSSGSCSCESQWIGDGECDLGLCSNCEKFLDQGEFDGGDCKYAEQCTCTEEWVGDGVCDQDLCQNCPDFYKGGDFDGGDCEGKEDANNLCQ